MSNHMKLHEAIVFAAQAHKGQVRKGNGADYIIHPMEALQILTTMNADENLLIAGVLHDTVEDTGRTMTEIEERFGEDVVGLISGHTEDKGKSWKERKIAMISSVDEGDRRLKMLVLADIISNLRSTFADYQKIGDGTWKKFNAPKEEQSWYYSKMLDATEELRTDENAAEAYGEAIELYKKIFA